MSYKFFYLPTFKSWITCEHEKSKNTVTDSFLKSLSFNHINFLFWAYALNSSLNILFKDYSKQTNISKTNKLFLFHFHLNIVKLYLDL